MDANPYRALPAVDELLGSAREDPRFAPEGRAVLLAAIRDDLEASRGAIRDDGLDGDAVRHLYEAPRFLARLARALETRHERIYRGAINATGVVLHTGLGRAVLPQAARETIAEAAGFAILEIERRSGQRNRREDGIARLLEELTGAPAATVVNNNAGATLIALAALARGREVIVARGQLVEIGGSYRIPDVMAESGCRLVEVGTTNKVRLSDYAEAITDETALILRVHTSNYRIVGFTAEVPTGPLVELAREHDLLVMDDLGSGALFDLAPYGLPHEPLVQDSLEAGAGVVTFSGDKLLGGPQAGLIVGLEETIGKIQKHSLYRALRPDKVTFAALEATLQLYRDPEQARREIPVLRMLTEPASAFEARAAALAGELGGEAEVLPLESKVGGGAYAVESLPSLGLALSSPAFSAETLSARLRAGEPPVFGRIHDGRLRLDLRTVQPDEDAALLRALRAALDPDEG